MPTEIADLLAFGLTGSPWWGVALWFLVVTQLTIFSVTLFLHRSQAHRGVDFHPALNHFFRFWTWLTTAMVTKEWVAIHRKHHAKCETAEDPHSPQVYGIAKVAWHGVTLYQQARRDQAMVEQYGLGTPDDWIERKVYGRNSWLGPALMLFIDVALFGAVGLAIWAVQMLWIPIFAAGVINGFGHWWGYRNFETTDSSTNLTPWAFFVGGEELHNNHHAFPSSARFSMRSFEFDIGWSALKLFERLGLARILRVAPQLDVRPDVAEPDAETLRALLAHRASVMSAYFRTVILPALKAEAANAHANAQGRVDRLRRRLRKALANDGRWLDPAARERLSTWVAQRPKVAEVVEYRRRLAALLERSGKRSDEMLAQLNEWCRDAERSGIATLEEFARRMRGYVLVPAGAR
jgi:stearoyl-CoA desaturase (delta-9 desaturase)